MLIDYYAAGRSPRFSSSGGFGYLYFKPASQYTIFDGIGNNNSTLQIQSYSTGVAELKFFNTNGGSTSYNKITTSNYGGGNANLSIVPDGGKVGIGLLAPTAVLHLKASTATANTASLKIDAGVVATTPVSGNIESDGTHLWWTDSGGTRHQLDN
jgi:hypothetical protein